MFEDAPPVECRYCPQIAAAVSRLVVTEFGIHAVSVVAEDEGLHPAIQQHIANVAPINPEAAAFLATEEVTRLKQTVAGQQAEADAQRQEVLETIAKLTTGCAGILLTKFQTPAGRTITAVICGSDHVQDSDLPEPVYIERTDLT